MAKMAINGVEDYALKLSKLGRRSTEIAKKAVVAGAHPVADEMRKNLEANLSGAEYSKGSLLDAMGISPPDTDKKGFINAKVGFEGYDEDTKPTKEYPKGTPQAVKARAMESGTSKQKKKPFVRPAVRAKKDEAIAAMSAVIDSEIKKIM